MSLRVGGFSVSVVLGITADGGEFCEEGRGGEERRGGEGV